MLLLMPLSPETRAALEDTRRRNPVCICGLPKAGRVLRCAECQRALDELCRRRQ